MASMLHWFAGFQIGQMADQFGSAGATSGSDTVFSGMPHSAASHAKSQRSNRSLTEEPESLWTRQSDVRISAGGSEVVVMMY
jgi:hypothetical protein